jgi:hypothetical protein
METKKVDVVHDTRSNQRLTKEKLATMRPSDIAAVAAQRGYDVDGVTHRISHASFLKQQNESDAYAEDEGHTDSGDVPTDYAYGSSQKPNFNTPSVPSVHGGQGGLPPGAALGGGLDHTPGNEPMGEQASADDHTGKVEGDATLGAAGVEPEPDEPGSPEKPLMNTPVEGQKA